MVVESGAVTEMSDDKSRENRMRRMALRQGYRLEKRRRYDQLAADHGLFSLVDIPSGTRVNPTRRGFVHSWTLAEVEDFLTRPAEREQAQQELARRGPKPTRKPRK